MAKKTANNNAKKTQRAARLEREHPELWKQVQAGDLSERQASIKAGFVPAFIFQGNSLLEAVQKNWEHQTPPQRTAFKKWVAAAPLK